MKKEIGEHLIDIPEWRPGMELINEGLPPEECKWSRIKFPNIFYDINESTLTFASITQYDSNKKLITLSVEDSITVMNLVKKDIYRRINGVHIKIKDRIEWLCPDYYFFLQWFQQKDMAPTKEGTRYGNCRWIQNTILQLWNHVKHDEDIAGLALPKIKKSGITYLFVGAFLNEMLTTRNNDFLARIGSQSPNSSNACSFDISAYNGNIIKLLSVLLFPGFIVDNSDCSQIFFAS